MWDDYGGDDYMVMVITLIMIMLLMMLINYVWNGVISSHLCIMMI